MHTIMRSSSDLCKLKSQVNIDMEHGWMPSEIKTSKMHDNFHYCILKKSELKYIDTRYNSEIIISGVCQECGVTFKGGKNKKYCCNKCCKIASKRRIKQKQDSAETGKQELLSEKYKEK